MKVLAKIMSVESDQNQNSKVSARVKLLLDQPFDALELSLFEFHEKTGVLSAFRNLEGKEALVPLDLEEYKGKKELKLSYGAMPELYLLPAVDTRTGEIKIQPKSGLSKIANAKSA
ncbi:MAG: hypothetical protein JKY24_04575 [Pseudomonadales bacterium]|nr:hypothetical protein [Pseudomonadales bacterium]